MLDGGTLLGAWRDNDFCEDDWDDIDLTTFIDQWDKKDAIISLAEKAGFSLYHSWDIVDDNTPQLAFKKDGCKIDLMFKKQRGDKFYWCVYGRNRRVYKEVFAGYYLEREKIKFQGLKFERPEEIDGYLRARYGNWKTPVHRKDYSCYKNDGCIVEERQVIKYKKAVCWGVWDMLHEGHLNLLERAKECCDELIVGVSNDKYCKKTKKKTPFFDFKHRIKVIRSLKIVSEAYEQGPDFTKKDLVKLVKPDAVIVGDDWKGKDWDGARLGLPVVYLPYTEGVCSTDLREKIKTYKAGGADMSNLTAIIINFLRPEYTKVCVESLKKLYPTINIIVGENGEQDDDLEDFLNKYNCQYVLLPFDSGVCYARNRLVEQVKTDYVMISDNDFYFDTGAKVEEMMKFMNANDFDLVGGRISERGEVKNYQGFFTFFDDYLKTDALNINRVKYDYDKASGLNYTKVDLVFNYFVAKTDFVLDNKWCEEIKVAYEHSLWFVSLKKKNAKIAFSPDPIVVHKPEWVKIDNTKYLPYRSRLSDKVAFFKHLGLKYTIGMNGRVHSLDTVDIRKSVAEKNGGKFDILIKTINRPASLEKLLFSIVEFYPHATILVGDDAKKFDKTYYVKLWDKMIKKGFKNKPTAFNLPFDIGLSAGRNFLAAKSNAKYKLFVDDDFVFTKDTKIEKMLELAQMDDSIGVVGGLLFNENGREAHFEANLSKDDRDLVMTDISRDYKTYKNIEYQNADIVLNFALVKHEVLQDMLWDDNIKIMGEHTDFFWRLKKRGKYRVIYTPEVSAQHIKDLSVKSYKELRSRKEFLKLLFIKHDIDRLVYPSGFCYQYDRETDAITNYRVR